MTRLIPRSKPHAVSSAYMYTSTSIYRHLSSQTTRRQSQYITSATTTQGYVSLPSSLQHQQQPQQQRATLAHRMPKAPPLSILPLTFLVRGVIINTILSSSLLLPISLKIVEKLANSHSAVLNPDRNVLLRWFLKATFYAHFCAGENEKEVLKTKKSLMDMGFKGIMLCYAKEVVLDEKASQELEVSGNTTVAESLVNTEILPWKKGTLETVSMTEPGDFVALKFTGAGSQALYALSHNLDPSPALEAAITEICDLAASRGVRLVFDAEQAALQKGIDAWTLKYMRRYNTASSTRAVVYCTYQAYLKAVPAVLAAHLATARREGFTLGVKIVRGAYLDSDPRHLINDTKQDTDTMYDSLAESLMRRQYGIVLRPDTPQEGSELFPNLSLALATHNISSVRKAQAIRNEQAAKGEPRIDMVYAQLQGMADEVSAELVQAAALAEEDLEAAKCAGIDIPQAYKYLVWGSTGECLKYLMRRAQENKSSVQRTRDDRDAMAGEIWRRIKRLFRLSSNAS